MQLLKYVPFVMRCAESSVMKTRALAATALASLITSSSYESQIEDLMNKISQTSYENHVHGYLLMVKILYNNYIINNNYYIIINNESFHA